MKKYLLLGLTVILSGSECLAGGCQGIYGLGPSDALTKKTALTIGMGSEEWIFTLGILFNSQYSDGDFQDTPIPHSEYQNLGDQRIGNTMGIDILRSYRINESNFSVFGGAGLYFGTKATLVKSNVTGLLWAQDKKSVLNPGAELGFFYGEIASKQFGLSYNTVKGVSVYLKAGNF